MIFEAIKKMTMEKTQGTASCWKTPVWTKLHWTSNSTLHLLVIFTSVCALVLFGGVGLLVYPITLFIIDVLYYSYGIQVFDPSVTIASGYNLSLFFHDEPFSKGLDYGFNYYNGNYDKNREQAQKDKFDHIYKQLELKSGMSLIDVGCGCGDWLNYLRGRGVDCVGVNITHDQAQVCRNRGLKVYWTDWKRIPVDPKLQGELYGKFDRITFLDTVEHYVPAKLRHDQKAVDSIYRNMFDMAHHLMKPGKEGKIFISCLHVKGRLKDYGFSWTWLKRTYCCYLLDKFHSGNYPNAKRDSLVNCGKEWFTLEKRENLTLDYYMTSILEPSHFGRHRFKLTFKRLMYLFWFVIIDPFWFQRTLWYFDEGWMQQFDKDIDKSHMVLYWLTFAQK